MCRIHWGGRRGSPGCSCCGCHQGGRRCRQGLLDGGLRPGCPLAVGGPPTRCDCAHEHWIGKRVEQAGPRAGVSTSASALARALQGSRYEVPGAIPRVAPARGSWRASRLGGGSRPLAGALAGHRQWSSAQREDQHFTRTERIVPHPQWSAEGGSRLQRRTRRTRAFPKISRSSPRVAGCASTDRVRERRRGARAPLSEPSVSSTGIEPGCRSMMVRA